jgi:hypothetical protein
VRGSPWRFHCLQELKKLRSTYASCTSISKSDSQVSCWSCQRLEFRQFARLCSSQSSSKLPALAVELSHSAECSSHAIMAMYQESADIKDDMIATYALGT